MQRSGVQRIALQPLGPEAVREMLGAAIGNDPSVRGLPDLIHTRTGGNPFFAEEIVQALIEDGSLAGAPGAYRLTRTLDKVPLPETVQTVLAARIDRLGPRAKQVLQTGAVIGRNLPRGLLAAVCEVAGAELDGALAVLRRGEFLYETALYPQVEYAFKHPLTHEVAYQSQLAARRSAVHRAVAHAMETLYGEQLDERAAEIAWHWEGAEERGVAARWYARAANWVEQRDVRAALRHGRAAYDLLPEIPEDRAEAELLIEVCAQLLLAGWSLGQTDAESSALLERGGRAAQHLGDIRAQVRLRAAYANSRITRGRITEFLVHTRESARLAEESSDEASRALTRFQLACAEGFAGNLDACEQSLEAFFRSEAADVSMFPAVTQRAVAQGWRGFVLQYRGRMAEAATDIARAREIAASAEPLTQVLVCHLIFLFAEARGEYPGALELAAHMLTLAEELGAINLRAVALGGVARAHALRGEWKEAARLFEETSAIAQERAVYLECEGWDLASLAQAHVALGAPGRAKEVAERGIALVRERGSTIQELHNVVALARAEVALDHDDAVDPLLARAEALIGEMGALALRPHLAEIRAECARRRGDDAECRAQLVEAHRLFAEQGATGHAARLRDRL